MTEFNYLGINVPDATFQTSPADGLIETFALLKDQDIMFVALIQGKTKGGEELHQVTELVLFLYSPPRIYFGT